MVTKVILVNIIIYVPLNKIESKLLKEDQHEWSKYIIGYLLS